MELGLGLGLGLGWSWGWGLGLGLGLGLPVERVCGVHSHRAHAERAVCSLLAG